MTGEVYRLHADNSSKNAVRLIRTREDILKLQILGLSLSPFRRTFVAIFLRMAIKLKWAVSSPPPDANNFSLAFYYLLIHI
jgi:hypothetical protein